MECEDLYICQSKRTFGEWLKEHIKAPCSSYDNSNNTGHNITVDNFRIVRREEQNLARTIKESIYMRVNGASLKKNIGKYHLSHIWDEILINTPELKLK